MRECFVTTEPYNRGFLERGIHRVYFEEGGNKNGKPILFLHGGPGSGCDAGSYRFFDPEYYRVILMDQRGSGKSTPYACLEENTTWHLVEDMECLRKHLKIEKWALFGGSWGSTLALAYATQHPERVLSMILRGIFLCRKKDIDWFYLEQGARRIFPEEWEKFIEILTVEERTNPLISYYHILQNPQGKNYKEAALRWMRWEASALSLRFNKEIFDNFATDERMLALSRLESFYFYHNGFFKTDNFLIEEAYKLRAIPMVIVHGRYDIICPFDNAWDLKRALPQAKLVVVADAGHTASEPGITQALLEATEVYKH